MSNGHQLAPCEEKEFDKEEIKKAYLSQHQAHSINNDIIIKRLLDKTLCLPKT